MTQTLLALAALVALTMLTLGQVRDRVRNDADAYQLDAVVAARGVGVEVLERLSGYPFDGGEGGVVSSLVGASGVTGSGTDAYSPQSRFGSDSVATGRMLDDLFANAGWDDLDDFDGVDGVVAPVRVTDPSTGAVRSRDFTVSVEVRYAEQEASGNWRAALSPLTRSHCKRAIVRVDAPSLSTPLTFGRVYAAP